MRKFKIFKKTIISFFLLFNFLIIANCGKAIEPKPGNYKWQDVLISTGLLHVELSLSFTVTDDNQIIDAQAMTIKNREKVTMTPKRTSIIKNGRIRISDFSLPHGLSELVFEGKFVTPDKIEGMYQSYEHEGTWSTSLSDN